MHTLCWQAACTGPKAVSDACRRARLQEEGHVTLRMMARPGRIRGVGSIFGVLRNVLPGDTADTVGKIRLLTGQPEGDGAP
jgi:GUCT (NUC152) domain